MESQSVNIHKKIIDRCRRGERGAQYELYQLYQKAMYNTALRICNDRDLAEDALQDAFVSAFGNLQQYREDASFGSWLKRIVINKSLNLVAKNKKYEPLEEDEGVNEPFYEWEDVLDHSLTVERIKAVITTLPDGFRNVLTLYLFEGYDHKEIAEILGITESTSKSQYNRAKKKIREQLNEQVNYG